MVKQALVAVTAALSCACGFRSPAPVPEPPREIAVAVVAQNPDGIGIPGAIVGVGDQRGEANIDGYHIFDHVPVCQVEACRLNVHAEAKGFVSYDGPYHTFPGMPDFQVRLQPAARPTPPRSYPAESGWLRVKDKTFITEDGRPWLWVGVGSFRMLERHLAGEDVGPLLEEAVANGFNIVRVFGMYTCRRHGDGSCDPGSGIGWLIPAEHAGYYDQVTSLAALAAEKGIRIEFTALADAQIAMPSMAEELLHLQRLLAAVRESWNVVVEIANEPFKNLPNGAATAELLWQDVAPRRGRTLISIGNYDVPEFAPSFVHGDYLTFHPSRKNEWPRLSHDLMDLRDGFTWADGTLFAGVRVPVVADEPIGAAEVDKPGARSNRADDFLHWGAGCGLFGAGCTFHSDAGIQSVPLGPNQQAAASAFAFAMRWVPADAQLAGYQRGGEAGGPGIGNIPVIHDDSRELRTFCKNIGREYCVQIRTNRVSADGRDGWRAVSEPRRGLVELVR